MENLELIKEQQRKTCHIKQEGGNTQDDKNSTFTKRLKNIAIHMWCKKTIKSIVMDRPSAIKTAKTIKTLQLIFAITIAFQYKVKSIVPYTGSLR